ncbi:variant erythrocyte surface antigen-1 family protein protein, putative [Babesia ovis]|uniref:Variant erythrocyte surface antigen-1 family protein protein, putative n=1 Tax=Babesia ovis TaxID=5869 RepID=A0A9W5TFB5_BABOV|nr:variant erythrocyte surface antigen-1 family protein protein, putative [Babesia ovis]
MLTQNVEGYLDEEELGVVTGTLRDLQGVDGTRRISELVVGVATGLQGFVGWSPSASGGSKEGDIVTGGIGRCGNTTGGCTCGQQDGKCKGKKYTSSYQRDGSDSKWDQIYQKCTGSTRSSNKDAVKGTSGTLAILARILLGAIPLVFSGLSYMAWMAVTVKNDNNLKVPLKHYVERMGYRWEEWRLVSTVKDVGEGVDMGGKDGNGGLIGVFEGCKVFEGVTPSGNYAQYLEKLRTEAIRDTTTDKHSLLKLNVLCSGYFRSLHTIDGIRDPRPRTPNTIREILTLVPKVQEMIERVKGNDNQVIFYAKDVGNQDKQLEVSPQNCAMYLLGGALVAPMVLLCIQDTLECLVGSDKANNMLIGNDNYKLENYENKVPIHDLYANMQFWFSYPMSETQSYYLLQDCLVALYYQLYFLECQCMSTRVSGEGWGYCKYGDQVKCEDGVKGSIGCLSWICPVGNKEAHKNGKSDGTNPCGCAKNPSPLQAFLCDCLKGFTCDVVMEKMKKNGVTSNDSNKKLNTLSVYSKCYPGFLSHRGHTMSVFGQECAVPMGFSGSFRSKSEGGKDMIGLGIYGALNYYSSDDIATSNLYQITRCICSLTRRVPRSTGTLFGFFYGLGLVYGNTKKQDFKKALNTELNCCPGWRDPECLMGALKDWTETDHSKNHTDGKPANPTLGSLYMCNNANSSASCGYYLQTLTGSMYKCVSDSFCETYVSWIVHLTGVLQSGLESLRDAFVKIDCSTSGCTGKGGSGPCECPKEGCKPGSHGDKCCCDNVVFCAGVHGLFYRFGFTYTHAWAVGLSPNWKKTCKQFSEQLGKVITEGLFTTLQTQLRNFIYSTRALFGVYIGVYWSIVLVYLLWSMTVNLDLMHIQSHWRSPGSYLVPLQRILADGSRNVKRVCTIGYFQDSGDRLLSQAVSDVYL